MESFVVDRQAMNSIRCMQVFVRVHSQIRLRRLKKLEENHALQKRLLQKHSKELEIFQVFIITYQFSSTILCWRWMSLSTVQQRDWFLSNLSKLFKTSSFSCFNYFLLASFFNCYQNIEILTGWERVEWQHAIKGTGWG